MKRGNVPTAIHVGSIMLLGVAVLAMDLNDGLDAAAVFTVGVLLAGMIGLNLGCVLGAHGHIKIARGDLTWLHFIAGVVMLAGMVIVVVGSLQIGVLIALVAVVLGWLAEAR